MGHPCSVGKLTVDAVAVLEELELERRRAETEALLEQARVDPVAPYRTKPWYPRFVVWELTLACNMRCEHCGSAAGRARPDELTRDEMLRVCDDLGELGCERVTLLGGEPLIHPHWDAVARRIRDNGFRANVITNGWTLADEGLCDRLAAAELSIVGVSVDGLERSHDKLRHKPGSFRRIVRGLELLGARGIPRAVATVVTNDSLDDLPELYGFLLEQGIKVWQLQIGNPLGRMQRDDPVLISPARLPELFDFITAKQAANRSGQAPLRVDIADNVGYYGAAEHGGIRRKAKGQAFHWTGCHAGIQGMGLDSNGDVKGCQSLPSTPEFIEGNLRERPLREIWEDPDGFAYTRRFDLSMLEGACARCSWGPLCKGGCTSAALAHTGCVGDNPICIHRVTELEAGLEP